MAELLLASSNGCVAAVYALLAVCSTWWNCEGRDMQLVSRKPGEANRHCLPSVCVEKRFPATRVDENISKIQQY